MGEANPDVLQGHPKFSLVRAVWPDMVPAIRVWKDRN